MPRKVFRSRLAVLFVVLTIAAFAGVRFVSYAQKKAAPAAPTAPAITATETLTDPNTIGVNNGDTKAQPGETLVATVTVTNNGTDATGVTLSDSPGDPLSPNGANGLFTIGPAAAPDTYNNLIGNVNLAIPTGAGSLLSNDVNPSGLGVLSITGFGDTPAHANQNPAGTPVLLTGIGTVNVRSDGSFDFDGLTGITAQKQFFYTLSNGTLTSIGTVTVNYQATNIWFINNAGGACTSNCDGRLTHPFTSISNFQAAQGGGAGKPAIGDTIFLTESGVGYTGPITLLNNQKFIGQDATASLLTITGLNTPPGTTQIPAMNPGAGNLATINASAGNGITLAQGNTVRGLTISGTTGAKISGTTFGTLTVGNNVTPDVTVSGAGKALDLTTGTFAATTGFASVTSTSSPGQGLSLTGVGGTASFGSTSISGSTFQGMVIGTSDAAINFGNTSVSGGTDGISLQNNPSGTWTFASITTSLCSNSGFIHGAGGGNVSVTGNSTISSVGDPIDVVNAANMTITFSQGLTLVRTGSGGTGFSWGGANNGAVFTANSMSIDTNAGTGMNIGGGTVNIQNAVGAITSQINSATEAAPAIIADSVTLNANFQTVNSSGASTPSPGNRGISLNNIAGSLTINGGTLSGAAGDEFFASSSNGSFTYNGTISSGSAHSVNVTGKVGGTVNFGGLVTDTDTGISLTNNTGATINFSGGISANTGTNPAFTATGGGTISATQNNTTIVNTLTTTTGTALNVTDTIGASGMTFRKISSSGAASGVILNGTGGGAFTITGNGTANCKTTAANCDGGTIQSSTGPGMNLTSVGGAVSLTNINVTGGGDDGIRGNGVGGLTIVTSQVTNNGNAVTERGVEMTNLTGSGAVTNSTFSGNAEDNFWIQNSSGTLSAFIVTGSTFSNTSTTIGNDGFHFEGLGNAVMSVNISGSTFSHNRGDHFQVTTDAVSAANMTAFFLSNTLSGDSGVSVGGLPHGGTDTGACITINPGGTAQVHTKISGNNIQGAVTSAITLDSSNSSLIEGTVSNNIIGTAGTQDSGSSQGDGMSIFAINTSTVTVAISGNTIRQYSNLYGIQVATSSGTNANINATITGNTVGTPGFFGDSALRVKGGAATNDGGTICADIGGAGALVNNVAAGANPSGTNDVSIRERFNTNIRIPGAPATDTTSIGNFIVARNSPPPTITVTDDLGGGTFQNGAACTQPATTSPAPGDIGGAYASISYEPAIFGTDGASIMSEPVANVLGSDVARSEVIAVPRQASTENKPSLIAELYDKMTSSIEPTVEAQSGPTSGSITTSPTFTLPAGSSVTITYQLTVGAGPYAAGLNNLTDAAIVSGGNFSNQAATGGTIPLDANPNFSVANTDSSPVTQPGAVLIYPVSATNSTYTTNGQTNGQTATGVVLTQTVPTGTTYNATSSNAGWGGVGCVNGAAAGTVCTLTIASLPADNTPVVRNFAVNVPANAGPTLLSIADSASVVDDTTNGPNQAGAVTNILDTDQVQGIWLGGTSTDWAIATNWSNSLLPGTAPIAPASQNISVPTGGGANSPEVVSADVLVNSVVLGGNKGLTIDSGRTLTVNSSISIGANKVIGNPAGTGTLALISPATISFTPGSGWVQTAMSRSFVNGALTAGAEDNIAAPNAVDAPQATFTYPVGTSTGYFPVDVTPTAGSNGSLTVQTFNGTAGVVPPLDNTRTLQRYWTLTGGAGLTADVKFFYGPINVANGTTVNGIEANYRPQRVTGGVVTSFVDTCPGGPCVDETNHFIFMPQITTFAGNWTASALAPTAAMVGVTGRVFSADGRAIRGVRITLDDGTGHPMSVVSNAFGFYHFDEVRAGGTYILGASARGYTFTPQVVSVHDELTGLNLTALP